MRVRARAAAASAAAAVLLAVLAACGGGSGSSSDTSGGDGGATPTQAEKPSSRAEAARFLTQATFGPTDADIDRVMAIGYGAWIDEQFAKPASTNRPLWEAADAAVKAGNPGSSIYQDGTINAFWKNAISAPDQLRQRVAYSLSQIFVVSMQDGTVGDNPRAVAAYLDMLGDQGLSNYRGLLEAVSKHPMMATYLSSLKNQKADPKSGRVPDENYAREIMQLMSIGLHQLNSDGTEQLANGQPVDTYGQSDIAGMAKVFTGWSWACPEWPDNSCFYSGSANGNSDPDRTFKALLGYPQFHSLEAKTFLGVTIAAQPKGDPDASLKTALDTLANHPNVGPFIGKQLIQRLVTSNPSPQYVAAVAAAFNGAGGSARGDMKAVIKAVLMNPEARTITSTSGKLREPVLKLSAFLRAFPFKSDTGDYKVGNTDNPGTALGQTPLRSGSVFNFYRPGYIPPGTEAAKAGLAVPEMQLAQETTAAGYVNFMRDGINSGVGAYNGTVNGVTYNRRDLQADYTNELALADNSGALADRLNDRLMYGTMPAALKTTITGAVDKIVIPALNAAKTNQAQIDAAKLNRVKSAIFLTVVSPEFQVQR
ncbi:MAG TPA: DUF1800 domain-containing protein [Burkholderiaceae bacterium]